MMLSVKMLYMVLLASSGTLAPATPSDAPQHIAKEDLWAISDMLVVGYACPTCNSALADPDPAGTAILPSVQNAVLDFATLLPEVHPVAACRKQFAMVLASTKVKDVQFIDKMAAVSRSCIGGGACTGSPVTGWFCKVADLDWTKYSCKAPDGSTTLCQNYKDHNAAGPSSQPSWITPSASSACKSPLNTQWPRACSFWSSLHTMSLRADAMNKQFELVAAIAPTIASGSLLCNGCVKHYMLFMKDLWATSPAWKVFAEMGTTLAGSPEIKCFPQCGEAKAHVDTFMCTADKKFGATCSVPAAYKDEQTDMVAFQNLIATFLKGKLAYPLFSLVAVHHNLVTYGVDIKWLNPPGGGRRLAPSKAGKTFLTPKEACESLKKGALWADIFEDAKAADCSTKTPPAVPGVKWSPVAAPWVAPPAKPTTKPTLKKVVVGPPVTAAPTAAPTANPCAPAVTPAVNPCAPVVKPVAIAPPANPCAPATAAPKPAVNPCAPATAAPQPAVNPCAPATAAPKPAVNPCAPAIKPVASAPPATPCAPPNPCAPAVKPALYSAQVIHPGGKRTNATVVSVLPAMGMFAMFAFVAAVGASIYKRRSSDHEVVREVHLLDAELNEADPME